MIERMKKITFLVTNSEYEGFITSLRNMGVVHIQQLQQGASSPQIQQAMDLEQRYRAAMLALEAAAKTFRGKVSPKPLEVTDKPSDTLEAVEGLQALQTAIEHENDEVRKNIDALEPWGEFDQERLRALEMETGMKVCHYRCSSKYFSQEWVDKYFATPVAEQDKRTYFVTFSPETPDIQAERLYLPQGTLEGFKEICQLEQRMQDARAQMLYANDNLKPLLRQGQVDALNDIQLSRVRLSDESVAGDYLRLMVGWVRADGAQAISERLDSEGIYYDIEDPAFEDDVPIQLTNGSYTKLFEPILRMYSLPNYHDIDPSLFFAPFFMLFFGLCLGDGGYGLIVLVGGALLACKGSGDMRNYGRLGIWLGLMTTICGLLTGTVFGIDLTQQDWAILAPVKPYFINDNGVGHLRLLAHDGIIRHHRTRTGAARHGAQGMQGLEELRLALCHRLVLMGHSHHSRHRPLRGACLRGAIAHGGTNLADRHHSRRRRRHIPIQQPRQLQASRTRAAQQHRRGRLEHIRHGYRPARRPVKLHPSLRPGTDRRRAGRSLQLPGV